MRRFFTVNGRERADSLQLQHTAQNSPLVRSWSMHGGDAGKTWAESTYAKGVAEGEADEDQWVTLLRTEPDQLYERLNFGAWKWEYGMDARQAARFVEEYTRTHRTDFRYDRAFGESGEAVKTALIRRIEGDNPFKTLARAVTHKHLVASARMDLVEHRRSLGHPTLNWPEFIAYFVIGAHDSKVGSQLSESSSFPWRGRHPRSVMEYIDPVASYVTFFHPDGACYHKDAPQGVLSGIDHLMWQVSEGELTNEVQARELLHAARGWTAHHNHARGLGHTLLEAWARREWDWFVEALPLDSSMRAPFMAFVAKAAGTWLDKG
jgi:hypothetical protein